MRYESSEQANGPHSARFARSTAQVRLRQLPQHDQRKLKVGLVGTYPPTECGIATFTHNTRQSILAVRPKWDVAVVRLSEDEHFESSNEVVATWVRSQPGSLRRVARYLNTCDVVLIQHEFGIFSGRDGEGVLDLMDLIRVPTIVELHTVLAKPSQHQYEIIQQLLDTADLAVVPSTSALQRLRSMHRAPRTTMVPHGAAANFSKPSNERRVPSILTWGLLGRGKGVEFGIAALSQLRDFNMNATYTVSGHTHPNERMNGVDSYREFLVDLVQSHGVGDRVHFDNEYRDWHSLRALVRSAHVVLLPYESRDQVCSGVLVEALASGKPVVATKFPHAVELLSNGAGILVDYDDVDAMASALYRVLWEPGVAAKMASRSREAGEQLVWPCVGEAFARLLEEQFEMELVV